MTYIDGFLIPLSVEKIDEYRKMAEEAGAVWMEHGALAFVENIADDLNAEDGMRPFPLAADAREGETVLFSYIVFQSREHRDEVNAKVMADPRIKDACKNEDVFDFKRMAYGGFKTIVSL